MLNLYITSPTRKSGKTFLTAGISATMQSLGYSTSVYKPVQTSASEINGFIQSQDIALIKTIDPFINANCSYLYKTVAEPLIASEVESKLIDINTITTDYTGLCSNSDCIIVDSDGGLMSPLTAEFQNMDLVKHLQLPLLMVISPNEDSINTTLSSLYVAQDKGIQIRGVIINNITENCSKTLLTSISRVIEEYSGTKILGLIPHIGNKFLPQDLIAATLSGVDIESIFNVRIEKLEFCS